MSYELMIKRVYAIVADCPRGVQPDAPFHTVEGPTEGEVVPVDELPDASVRQFDVRMTDAPQDDGDSGFVRTRFRVGLDIRIRYPVSPRSMSEVMIGDDVAQLVNALIAPSNHIGSPIEVILTGRRRAEELISDSGAAIALLLVQPIEVIYTAL